MSLFRSIATIGGWTMGSRVLGFVRDILIAGSLGAGLVADAFFVAFKFPNFFRRLFAEGAFNAAFVPLFAQELATHGRAAAREFVERVFGVMLVLLLALTFVVEVYMGEVMGLVAGGFADDPEKFALAVDFARLTFPYLLFVSLATMLSGILNTLNRFVAAAAAEAVAQAEEGGDDGDGGRLGAGPGLGDNAFSISLNLSTESLIYAIFSSVRPTYVPKKNELVVTN